MAVAVSRYPVVFWAAAAAAVLMAVAVTQTVPWQLTLALCLAAPVAGLLAWNLPFLWLILLVFLPFSLEVQNALGSGNHLVVPSELLAPLGVVGVGALLLRKGQIRLVASALTAAVAAYMFYGALTLLWTELPLVTLKAFLRSVTYCLAGFLLPQVVVDNPRRLKQSLLVLGVASAGVAIYGLLTQMREGIRVYQEIAAPFFTEHCIYAAYLVFPLMFCLAWLSQPVPGRKFVAVLTAILGIGVMLSFVRGAWISVGVAGMYLFVCSGRLNRKVLLLTLLLLVLLAGGLVSNLGVQELFQERWETLFDTRYVSNENRIDRWMAAIKLWQLVPWHGAGLGTYPDLYPRHVHYPFAFETEKHMGAHNLYLEILAEQGLIGLLLFTGLILAFFGRCLVLRRWLPKCAEVPRTVVLGLETMLMAFLVHAVVNNLGPSDKVELLFWTALGLSLSPAISNACQPADHYVREDMKR